MRGIAWLIVSAAVFVALGSGLASAQTPGPSASPSPTSTPPPQPTPWPPATNLGVKASCQITNPDGSFIPPAERSCTAMVVWAHTPGFTGEYELERQIQPWMPPPGPFERIATMPASSALNGELRYDDTFSFMEAMGTVRCYRVRTVINGETGPYTNEVCESFVGVTGGPGTAPQPPNTGSGIATGDVVAAGWAIAGALAVIVGSLGALASRRRQ